MIEEKYINESKNYLSESANSWYVIGTNVGPEQFCSITFVKYVAKVHKNEFNQMSSISDLNAEAIATISLSEYQARDLAQTIVQQLDALNNKV
ncbi:hypothetical protein [Leclercia sp. CFBP8987]|uniref:hypothetical protein n=1 Tax=Leclercia sp. CFBP8987 TaxID=3096525 RepID=UPI002A6B38D6|nr:hypothetical protein [Leclercia sp. CFBP8987]MDY0920367.1 hypothetical protein [Leclercia sp. CFBP8987]